jgi:hypothetical protein
MGQLPDRFDGWLAIFEPPDAAELALLDFPPHSN